MKTKIYLYSLLCLLFVGMVVLPCGAEEPVDDPIEEPVESKIYLPLFGEYETSYNIYVSCEMAGIDVTDSLCYKGEQVIDGKTYKAFNADMYLRVTDDNSKVYLRYKTYWGDSEWKEALMFDLSLEKGGLFYLSEW